MVAAALVAPTLRGLGPSILCPTTSNNNAHYKTKKRTLGESQFGLTKSLYDHIIIFPTLNDPKEDRTNSGGQRILLLGVVYRIEMF